MSPELQKLYHRALARAVLLSVLRCWRAGRGVTAAWAVEHGSVPPEFGDPIAWAWGQCEHPDVADMLLAQLASGNPSTVRAGGAAVRYEVVDDARERADRLWAAWPKSERDRHVCRAIRRHVPTVTLADVVAHRAPWKASDRFGEAVLFGRKLAR